MKVIVLAAGKGTRLKSEQDIPKVMRLVGGRPMLSYVLDNLGFIPQKDISVVVGCKKEVVIEGIGGEYNYPVQDELVGTGRAVISARESLGKDSEDGDVLVCYGDMPLVSRKTYESLIEAHRSGNTDCTILTANAPKTSLHYGRIIRKVNEFQKILEYRDCTEEEAENNHELNAGVYMFKIKPLYEALSRLDNKNDQGEYHLTDVPGILLTKGYKVGTHTIYNPNEIYGVNTPDELELVDRLLNRLKGIGDVRKGNRWFGTGGWRSLIGEDFTKANVQILSQSIADNMKSKSYTEIVIGYDRRFLSDKAAVWAAEVFAGNEIKVFFIGRISPTPLVMYTVKKYDTPFGMAVTASHNPADYNGIKVFTRGGRDAAAEVTDIFEEIIHQGVTPVTKNFDRGVVEGIIQVIDPNNDYIDNIIEMIDMKAIRGGNLRVLLDPMFGVSKTTLQTILMTARCDVDIINDRHDTLFGGRLPSPSAETLTKLRDMVLQYRYDLGIGTDGDADRIGIIDNTGCYVHPNEILVLLYYYLLHYKGWRGDCVRNVATTHILDRIARDYGQSCHEVPVGFKHISSKMELTDAVIGGESSGGLTIRGHIKGKDGIFASTLIVEMICATGKKIPELLKEISDKYGSSCMEEYDTKFSEEKKEALIKLLFTDKLLPDFEIDIDHVSYLDGCKVYFANGGWIIARFSGTEPLLRIFCEMPEKKEGERCVKILREFLDI